MRWLLNAALVVGGLIWLGLTFRAQLAEILAGTAGFDFHNYYYSTKAFRFHGASIYDHEAMSALSREEQGTPWVPPYVYPPYLTVPFLPLVSLRYETVRVLWLLLSYGFLFGTFEAMRRLCVFVGKRPVDWRLTWLVPIFAASLFSPLLEHNWYGQSNLLVLVLLSWGIYLEWKRPFRFPVGELLLATAGLLKLFPMFLFPCYLAMRRYRTVGAIAGWSVLLTGMTLLFIPFGEFLRFPEVLNASMYVATSQEHFYQDHSASSALRYLIAPAAVPAVAIFLVRFVPYGGYLAAFRAEAGRPGRLGMAHLLRLSQAFVLLSFVMFRWWEHHLVMLFFPCFIAAYECSRAPRARVAPAVCLAASAAYIGIVYHPALRDWLGQYLEAAMQGKLAAQLILFGVLEYLIRKPFPTADGEQPPQARSAKA